MFESKPPHRPFPDPVNLTTLPQISQSIQKDLRVFGRLPPLFVAMYRVLVAGIKGAEKLQKK